MFNTGDPRTALSGSSTDLTAAAASERRFAHAQAFVLPELTPSFRNADSSPCWILRAANFVVLAAEVSAGDVVDLPDTGGDEAIVVVDQPGVGCQLDTDTHHAAVERPAVVIMPGPFRITAKTGGRIFCILSNRAGKVINRASNADFYAHPDPSVAPLPPPVRGPGEVRVHYLDDIPADPKRFGRIFRSDTLMVNLLLAEPGPRDPDRLSPHSHDNFEQCSVTFEGEYLHHLRTPWTPRSTRWRADEHLYMHSPSVTIIPARIIHTTQSTGAGQHRMMDVFAPPRTDFLALDGWVLNATDYEDR